jgi:LmbE family N-acetylglucosaminyl deacetylase
MKKVVPIPKLLEHDSYAFIGAHPDDIEVGCGPTVARLVEMGKRICFIVATDGRYGMYDPEMTVEKTVELRKKEAVKAAEVLGVKDVRFLGFPDGGGYDVNELKDKIAIELADFEPDLIFTIDNHVKSETHPDHINCGRASEIAMLTCTLPLMMRELGVNKTAKPKGIVYYYTDKPNSYIKIKKRHLLKRIEALEAHHSQFIAGGEMSENFHLLKLLFKVMAIRYGLKSFRVYADAYRALSVMHLHCAPDASDF